MHPNGVDVIAVITQAGAVGLVGVMVWFFIFRFFPWYTQRYIPEKWAREDRVEAENTAILRGINENLAELRSTLATHQNGLAYLRETMTAEFVNIQRQLETVTMLSSLEVGTAVKTRGRRAASKGTGT